MQPGFSIVVAPDGLKAFMQIPPKISQFPNVKEIEAELNRLGITQCIDRNMILEISSGAITHGLVEIARGTPSLAGSPGRIELLIDTSKIGKPKALENGRVDHHEIGMVINVVKGTPLARRIPPEKGINGCNIFGKLIMAQSQGEVKFPVRHGTCISPENPDILISEIDGALIINSDGSIEVRNQNVIETDIDYSTGNISLNGDLIIHGTIRAGFHVEVNGNLRVIGNVEDTIIKSDGNIEIEGGAVGAGTGIIECKGSLRVRHLENFTIKSGGNVLVSEDALHSFAFCDGKIKAKSIIGGTFSGFEIECDSIGSTAETRTCIDIGRLYAIVEERVTLNNKKLKIDQSINNLKTRMFELVRDFMNESGKLCENDQKELATLKEKTLKSIQQNEIVKNRLGEIDQIKRTLGNKCGISAKCIYPNTSIKLGSEEKMVRSIWRDVNIIIGKQDEKIT